MSRRVHDGQPLGIAADEFNRWQETADQAAQGTRAGIPLARSRPTRPIAAIYGQNKTAAALAAGDLADLGDLLTDNASIALGDVVYQLDAVTSSGPLAIPLEPIAVNDTGRIAVGAGLVGGVFVANAVATTTHATRTTGTNQLTAATAGYPIIQVNSVVTGGAWCTVDFNSAFTPGGIGGGGPVLWGSPTAPSARSDGRPIVVESGGGPYGSETVVYIYPGTGTAPALSSSTVNQFHRVVIESEGGFPNVATGTSIAYCLVGSTFRACGSWDDHHLLDITDSLSAASRPGWCALSALSSAKQPSTSVNDGGTTWSLSPAYQDIVKISGNTLAYSLGAGVNVATLGINVTPSSGSTALDVDYGTNPAGAPWTPPTVMNPTTSLKGLITDAFIRCN